MIDSGSRVRIPRGTMLTSTHPKRDGPYPAGRTYSVRVYSVRHSYRRRVGQIVNGRYRVALHWRDCSRLCDRYGIKHQIPHDEENYAKLGELPNAVVEDSCHVHIKNVYLVISPRKVVWAGTGGYWIEALLSEVELVPGDSHD